MPVIWAGVDQSTRAPRLSFRKRARVILAAFFQDWHTKTCAECGFAWMALGPHTDLIAMCDRCEIRQMDKFAADMERKYQQQLKEIA